MTLFGYSEHRTSTDINLPKKFDESKELTIWRTFIRRQYKKIVRRRDLWSSQKTTSTGIYDIKNGVKGQGCYGKMLPPKLGNRNRWGKWGMGGGGARILEKVSSYYTQLSLGLGKYVIYIVHFFFTVKAIWCNFDRDS